MAHLNLKNVIGNEETATKLPLELFKKYADMELPIGKIIPSQWLPSAGYGLKKLKVGDIPIECIISEDSKSHKVILDLHGGGFVLGLSDLLREEAMVFARISDGAMIVSVEYRIAPPDTYPAALEDCISVYKWLLQEGYKGEDIIVAGGSAGGGLAAALGLYLRDHQLPLPKGIILMSPWADLNGMPHCFQQMTNLPESKKAWAEIEEFIKECFTT